MAEKREQWTSIRTAAREGGCSCLTVAFAAMRGELPYRALPGRMIEVDLSKVDDIPYARPGRKRGPKSRASVA